MSDPGTVRKAWWMSADGEWHWGPPPEDYWQAGDGLWYPPPARTDAMLAEARLGDAKHRKVKRRRGLGLRKGVRFGRGAGQLLES